jgi:hypothetical protein
MVRIQERSDNVGISACPYHNAEFTGHCQDCQQRIDCMMTTILHQLVSLETKMNSLLSKGAREAYRVKQ